MRNSGRIVAQAVVRFANWRRSADARWDGILRDQLGKEIDAVRNPSRRKGGGMAKKKGTKKAAKGGKEK